MFTLEELSFKIVLGPQLFLCSKGNLYGLFKQRMHIQTENTSNDEDSNEVIGSAELQGEDLDHEGLFLSPDTNYAGA